MRATAEPVMRIVQVQNLLAVPDDCTEVRSPKPASQRVIPRPFVVIPSHASK